MVELVPRENIVELEKDATAIQNIAENHSGQHGTWKVHIIEEKGVKTVDRNIPINMLLGMLDDSALEKFDTVTTWSCSHQSESPYSTAYGVRSGAIIVERIRDLANQVWLDIHPAWMENEVRVAIEPILQQISSKWDLVLVDRRLNLIVDTTDETALKEYLYREEK